MSADPMGLTPVSDGADDSPPVAPGVGAAARPRAGATGFSWGMAGLALVYAWVVASFEPFTVASSVVIFATGAVVLLVAFRFPPARVPTTRRLSGVGVGAWTLVLGAFAVQEISNFVLGSTREHPTLSILVAPFLQDHLLKAVAVLIWISVGWVLVRR